MRVRIHCNVFSDHAKRSSISSPMIYLMLAMQDAARCDAQSLDQGAGTEKLLPFSTTQVARTVAPCGPALLMWGSCARC